MSRFQVVYIKHGAPCVFWTSSKVAAAMFAEARRKAGFTVDVWEHAKAGATKIFI